MKKYGKNYRNASEKIEAGKLYEVADALALAIETAPAKFDETIEIHIRLGVDPRSADQQVRGSVVLPNGTGKTAKVVVIAKGDKADAAKAASADHTRQASCLATNGSPFPRGGGADAGSQRGHDASQRAADAQQAPGREHAGGN